MLNDKELVAIIPVRGGSKGIPRKNLYRLGQDTLLERAIKLGLACGRIDRVVVSTDDAEMHEIASRYGVAAPGLRPAHLATDTARTVDVALDLLDQIKVADAYILLLQATSPLRTLSDLEQLLDIFENTTGDAEAIVSLAKQDEPHPNKIQKMEDGFVRSYLNVDSTVPHQTLPTVYRFNGAFYLIHANTLRSKGTFVPPRTLPYIMPPERSINLDDPLDLILLEALVARHIVSPEDYLT